MSETRATVAGRDVFVARGWLFAAGALLAAGCAGRPGAASAGRDVRIDRVEHGLRLTQSIEARMRAYDVPGVSIAVVDRFDIDWTKTYGTLEDGSGRPVTPDTLFQAASISKFVNGILAMQQVQAGVLDLDRDVNEQLTSWRVPDNAFTTNEKVTLRRLLTHTAGTTVSGFPGYTRDAELPTLLQILDGTEPANTDPVRVDTVPGTAWRYSGGGVMIVEQLLEDVTRQAYVDLARTKVLEPAGMADSTFAQPLPAELRDRAAVAHGEDPATEGLTGRQAYPGKWHVYPEHAAAGLWTTPSDLGRLAIEVMRARTGQANRLLMPATAEAMLTPQWTRLPVTAMDMDMGLGPMLLNLGPHTLMNHAGLNAPGYSCFLLGLPERGWAVVVMTNGIQGSGLCYEVALSAAMAYGVIPSQRRLLTFAAALVVLASAIVLGPVLLVTHAIGHPAGAQEAEPQPDDITMPAVIMGAAGIVVTLLGSGVSLLLFFVPASAASLGDLRHLAVATAAGSIGLLTMALAIVCRRVWSVGPRLYYVLIAVAALMCTMHAFMLHFWPMR